MSKRLGAALAALLTFATVLAVVPLVSAEPADAHTKTVRRCAYDPFAGNQCWNESVPHTHPKPKTSTNYAPPPDTTPRTTTTTTTEAPKCPAGSSGTPPNCVPDPCPAGSSGTPPNCVPDPCPAGSSGTPPNCVQDDDGTGGDSSCGHPSQHQHDKLGCHPRSSDHDTNPTSCGPRSANHKHDGSGCHPATLDHCHDGQHSHEGSGCHAEDTEHGRGHDTASGRCVGRVPSHAHDGFGCHPVTTNHCHDGEHAHNGGGCHPIDHDSCPLGEHEHLTEQGSGCHPIGRDHYEPKEPSYFANVSKSVIGGLLCAGVAGAVSGGTAAAYAGVTCAGLIATFETASEKEKWRMLQEAKRRHAALVEKKNQQDRPSGGTTPSTTPSTTPATTPSTTPATTPGTPPPDSTPGTPPPTTTPQTPQEAWNDAMGKFIRGEINRAGLQTAADAYQCALGVKSKCK